MSKPKDPYWETKPLEALTQKEWESLCDGCGRCCLVKLEDEDTGKVHFTDIPAGFSMKNHAVAAITRSGAARSKTVSN